MFEKLLLCLLVGIISVSAHAQGKLVKDMVKVSKETSVVSKQAAKKVADIAASTIISASSMVGREALLLHPSVVGTKPYLIKTQRFEAVDRFLSKKIVARFEDFDWLVRPMDGFFVKFQPGQINVEREVLRLGQEYGTSRKFKGYFLADFMRVKALTSREVTDGTDLSAALKTAVEQAQAQRSGFLALAIEGNANRPKDVLLYDANTKNWISLNQSKAAYIRSVKLQELRKLFRDNNRYWGDLLERQGVVIRPDNYDVPNRLSVSLDGVNWQEMDAGSQLGEDLWNAWNEGFFIQYDRHSRKARFALSQDEVFFSSFENAVVYRDAKAAGMSVIESKDGNVVFLLTNTQFPNMFTRLKNDKLLSLSKVELKTGEDAVMSPVEFMKELREISLAALEKDPSRRLIFLPEAAVKGDFFDVEDCVLYLSKDGSVALPELAEVELLEKKK